MTAERVSQLAQRYRWELLTLLLSLALGNLWRLYNWFDFFGTDQWFLPSSGAEQFSWFITLSNLPAVTVFGLGLVLLLRRGKTMLAGLWAIILLPRAWALLAGIWPWPFHLLVRAVSPNGGQWDVWAINTTFYVVFGVIVALVAWRLGKLGVLHALLIGAGAAAWQWAAPGIRWPFPTGNLIAFVMTLVSVGLWLAMLAGLAFAFNEFLSWDRRRRERAIWALAAVPFLAVIVHMLSGVAYAPLSGRGWLGILFDPPFLFINLMTVGASVLVTLSLTWLLATRWPVEQPRLDAVPTAPAPPNDD